MYDEPRELVEALVCTPDTLVALLANVTEEQARAARGGDEGWSVIEVLCHLRDAEEFDLARMRAIRDQVGAHLTGFDQETWARDRDYANSDLASALAAFLELRSIHISELQALDRASWERSGAHRARGTVTIRNHTLHVLWHDSVHLAQIARQLGGSNPE